jgi:hypothetical protein
MQTYISHSEQDEKLVQSVARQLEREGFEVFDPDDITPGENWAARVGKAIESSRAMVVLLTDAAGRSPWVQRDIDFALGSLKYKNRLITVVVDANAEMPWILMRLPVIHVRRNNLREIGKLIAEELKGAAAA